MKKTTYLYVIRVEGIPLPHKNLMVYQVNQIKIMDKRNQKKINDLLTKAQNIIKILLNEENINNESITFMENRIKIIKSLKTNEDFSNYMKYVK